jgi:hypothetical protein
LDKFAVILILDCSNVRRGAAERFEQTYH